MKRLLTTVAATLFGFYTVLPFFQEKSKVEPMPWFQIYNNLPKSDSDKLETYVEAYYDPDIHIQWDFTVDLPRSFVDEILGDSLESTAKFFNSHFIVDRFGIKRIGGKDYSVSAYDINQELDVIEDSMFAKAHQLLYQLDTNPRTLMFTGEGYVTVGFDINGVGFGTLRYDGDSLQTAFRIDTYIEVVGFWGSILYGINNLLKFEDLSFESLKKREKVIQSDLEYAVDVMRTDTSFSLINRALSQKRITQEESNRFKEMIIKLNQNSYK